MFLSSTALVSYYVMTQREQDTWLLFKSTFISLVKAHIIKHKPLIVFSSYCSCHRCFREKEFLCNRSDVLTEKRSINTYGVTNVVKQVATIHLRHWGVTASTQSSNSWNVTFCSDIQVDTLVSIQQVHEWF